MAKHEWLGKPTSICTCGWSPDGIGLPSLYDSWLRHVSDAEHG